MHKSDDGLRCFVVLLSGLSLIIGAGAADDTILVPGIDLRDLNSIDVTGTNNIIKHPDTGMTHTLTEPASDFLNPSASGPVQRPISSLPSSTDNPVFPADSLNNETESSSGTSSRIAIYKDGSWYIDMNGDGVWNTGDRNAGFGAPSWLPVVGDWNGDGISEIGTYRNGAWYLDYDNSGSWNSVDKNYGFGAAGWTPVIGDWNADGFDEVGVYNNGAWYLDRDGDGNFDNGESCSFGSEGWTPVVGKWSSDGKTKIGIYKNGVYYIDYNGDGSYGAGDWTLSLGTTGSNPVIGDWNNNARYEVGTRTGNVWKLDYDGSYTWNTGDKTYVFGSAGWTPVIGDWNADGKDKIGIYLNGAWYLDANGNGVWDAGTDKNYAFGTTGWTPVIGKWALPQEVPQTQFYVYAEGISDYHNPDLYLSQGTVIASDFYNFINGKCGAASEDPDKCWYGGSRLYLNDYAGSKHWNYFEQASSYSDNADFAIFVGHGSNDSIVFGTQNSALQLSRANMNFGGTRLKWVTLNACEVLNQTTHTNWETVFNGVHIVNGYDTVGSLRQNQGTIYAEMLTGLGGGYDRKSIKNAWRQMLRETIHSANYKGAYMWAEPCGNDYLPGFGDYCSAPIKNGQGNYNITWEPFSCSYP